MTTIGERRPDFDQHNLFFIALLGLVRAGERLDGLLERFGASPLGPVQLPADAIARDPFLCCVLGLVSLRDGVRRHLAGAAAVRPASSPA
ncbi:MAG: hypothetical protein AB1689_02985, partial [Thermodesulfobacteriota bacterium]